MLAVGSANLLLEVLLLLLTNLCLLLEALLLVELVELWRLRLEALLMYNMRERTSWKVAGALFRPNGITALHSG